MSNEIAARNGGQIAKFDPEALAALDTVAKDCAISLRDAGNSIPPAPTLTFNR